jgi:hypothetical protein
MTHFVHPDFRDVHPGVERVERAATALKDMASRFDGVRGGASLLLAAVVSALVVVANQVVDAWGDGHLLAAWMVLWVVAFAALALLAAPARRAAALLRGSAHAWTEARRRDAEDQRTWNAALRDARIMADLSRAMNGIAVEDLRRYRF